MYISCMNNKFTLSSGSDNAVVCLQAPLYREAEGEQIAEYELRETGGQGSTAVYEDAANRVTLTVEQKKDTLFYIRRRWENLSDRARKIQTVLRVSPCFDVAKYLIPCVSVNGNVFGAGLEPKGLERDGEKWIFGYDREAIPACTLTENADFACALFASAEDAASLVSSCSVSRDHESGAWYQELFHPVIEKPVTYSTRDGYAEGYDSFIELGAGEVFETGMYLCVNRPRWENFGIAEVLDQALGLYGDNSDMFVPEKKALWDRSIAFARSLMTHYKDKKGFIIGFHRNQDDEFVYREDECFELAWCGQNILFSRMFIEDWARFGHKESLDDALEILDTRASFCTAKSGLLAAQLKDYEDLDNAEADTCNMGYGAYEFLRCWERLRELGIDKPAYLEAARGLCDFFCAHFSPEYGFGKAWRLDGVCTSEGGSIGAFVICPLVKIYALTKEEKYLAMAEKALKYYVERDLDKFCCTAGALDTSCVDKETSAPFIMSAVMLYELTGKPVYLEYAEKAAYYFTSWMFHYQPVYAPSSEIVRYNVCVKGLTSVSAQHHHLDMYAGIVVPYLRRLADLTGDEKWRVRADMMWNAVTQFIGDGELTVHGLLRPVGSQNEALFHCRWGFGTGKRGNLNDWLVAWPCAFRMSVLAEDFKEQE
ncbi:MAG: hypothetical protein E7463_15000 [Ruminococcaceae bacterium]|nr:hypothetical protein [Oscillospiraceae bacterium]